MSARWTVDQLKSQLIQRRGQLKGWVIQQENTRRRERYFLLDGGALAVDQDRDVQVLSTSVRLMVRLPRADHQGEITRKLLPGLPLPEQLDSAIAAALQTEYQAWELPLAAPSDREIPQVRSADPRIAEDIDQAMERITGQIRAAVARPRETTFNSSELFVSLHDRTLHFSNGLTHRSSQSRIYVEAAYSLARPGADGRIASDEYLGTRWAVSLDDLGIDALFDETSGRAARSLDVVRPGAGRYSVLVDAEVLSTLLSGHVSQLYARNAYQRLPHVRIGEPLVPGAIGDLLSIRLDPSIDFGADTVAVSDQGEPQHPLELVRDNIVVGTATDKQHSDYLGLPATTVRGNLAVASGSRSYAELIRSAPQVLEVLQFSGLFADPNSGTFASEIRLARIHDNARGTVAYVKGGSLSGSILENFRDARFSSERVRRAHFSSDFPHGQGYDGPEFALLGNVSIAG